MTVSKKTPRSRLLAFQLDHPVGESEAAEPMVRGARRDGVGRAAGLADLAQRLLPALLEADAEAGLDQAHVGAHDARQLDVADPVIDRIGPVDPALLDQDAAHAQVRGDRGDLAGVVGLDATDGHERVRTLRQRVRGEVLQLAHLVATKGEARVDVLALGPQGRATQMTREPLQGLDGRRAEGQRRSGERVQDHRRHRPTADERATARGGRRSSPSRRRRPGCRAHRSTHACGPPPQRGSAKV